MLDFGKYETPERMVQFAQSLNFCVDRKIIPKEAHWSFLLNEVNMIDALYLQMKDFASHTWAARCTSTRQSGFHA